MDRILPSAEEGLRREDLEKSKLNDDGFEKQDFIGEDPVDELIEEKSIVRSNGSSLV